MKRAAGPLRDIVAAYRRLFLDGEGNLTPDGKVVFDDLAIFCRFLESSVVVSPQAATTDVPATFLAEGRREVFLRLAARLRLETWRMVQRTAEVSDG